MYLHGVPEAAYADPWEIPFPDRYAQLRRGGTRIAYYYHRPDNSTFRYRCYNMAQVVNAAMPGVSAAHFSMYDEPDLDRVVDAADILVVCRARYTDRLNRLVHRAKGLGRRVAFDVDDLVFDPDYAHLLLSTLGQDATDEAWEHWFAHQARLGASLKLCDRVVVTNDYLADRVRAYADRDTRVVPNFLNREQLELSDRIAGAKRERGYARTDRVHIGYFSGTPTHARDFELIAPALARLLDRFPEMALRLVGFLEPPPCLARHLARIERLPLMDFVNLQRAIGATEINLVPLQDNAFTNCKSELKYFEAGAVGTVTVASPTFTYRAAITDGQNGYLARAHEWEHKLAGLIEGIGDVAPIAGQAYADSVARYAWTAQPPAIAAALLEG